MVLFLAFVVLVVLNQQRVVANRFCNNDPIPPLCANDCSGNGFYLSQDETSCLQCPTCEPGKELNKICGDGLNGDAQCVPCQEGSFSALRARRCTPCRICDNTVELQACERNSDRVCGDCLSGYLRSGDRFGDPDACPLRCRDQSPETPGCRDWWREQNDGEKREMEGDGDIPLEEESPQEHDDEQCESTPPQCEDDCHGNRLYLGRDGLCKLCLQCQPGHELDKDCGNGINGDAECQRCKEGTFSSDGRGPCIPCRICVNTEEVTGCEPTSDRECGDCLPGYFQAAKDFFPDPDACPNSCAKNLRDTPECIEWWQRQDAMMTNVGRPHSNTEPNEVQQPLHFEEEPVVFRKDESEGKDTQIVKEGSTTLHHSPYMTVITALASLLTIVVLLVVMALIILRIYTKRPRSKDTVITDAGGPLLSGSGNSTPRVATPDMSLSHSSSRIYNESPSLQRASSPPNTPQVWENIHPDHVQGALPCQIDDKKKDSSSYQPHLVHAEPDSKQPMQDNNRRASRFPAPPPLVLTSTVPSAAAMSPDGKEGIIVYSSDGNGTTWTVQEKNEIGTQLRRRSSILSPTTMTTPDGIQVLRKNSLQLNHLACDGSHTINEREKQNGSSGGPNDYPDSAEKEPEAGLFPVDSPNETDDKAANNIYKFNVPQDIEQGRNGQYGSFQDGKGTPFLRDMDLNIGAGNTGKQITNLPNQIEREPTIENRRKRATIPAGQKQRGQHPVTTSLTITSESPVININLTTPHVTSMQVGDIYHHDGTQDALLGSDDDIPDGKEDEGSEAEEDTTLMNT